MQAMAREHQQALREAGILANEELRQTVVDFNAKMVKEAQHFIARLEEARQEGKLLEEKCREMEEQARQQEEVAERIRTQHLQELK